MISDLVPESHQKILTNIRKTQERAKRKSKTNTEESDDEGETDFKVKSQPQRSDIFKNFIQILSRMAHSVTNNYYK